MNDPVNTTAKKPSFIESSLIPGERIVCFVEGSEKASKIRKRVLQSLYALTFAQIAIAILAKSGNWGASAFLFFAFSVLVSLFNLAGAFANSFFEQAITNKRVVRVSTFIFRGTDEMRLSEIESIEVRQGPFARSYNYGHIIARGRGIGATTLLWVLNPVEIKKTLEVEMEKAKQNSGKDQPPG